MPETHHQLLVNRDPQGHLLNDLTESRQLALSQRVDEVLVLGRVKEGVES